MAQGAPTLKRVHFELGGKNPVIVFDDADLDRALDAVVFMIYSLNGERCTSSSRAARRAVDRGGLHGRLVARARKLRVGHPLDPAPRSVRCASASRRKGAELLRRRARGGRRDTAGGGARGEQGGNYVSPTRSRARAQSQRVAQEEIFGPVLTVVPFDDEAEALSSRTTSATGSRRISGRTTSAARIASRAASRPAWSGSTRRTFATCRRRSAA